MLRPRGITAVLYPRVLPRCCDLEFFQAHQPSIIRSGFELGSGIELRVGYKSISRIIHKIAHPVGQTPESLFSESRKGTQSEGDGFGKSSSRHCHRPVARQILFHPVVESKSSSKLVRGGVSSWFLCWSVPILDYVCWCTKTVTSVGAPVVLGHKIGTAKRARGGNSSCAPSFNGGHS